MSKYEDFEDFEELDEFEEYEEIVEKPKQAPKKKTSSSAPAKKANHATSKGSHTTSRDNHATKKATPAKSKKKGKKGPNRKKQVIFLVAELLVLVVVGVVVWFVFQGTDKVEKIDVSDVTSNEGIDDYFEQMKTVTNEETGEVITSKGYRQIALFGVDSRDNNLSANTRSDTIIIASINLDTNEVKMVSLLRDTYLNLSNDSYNKCNAAYAFGGPSQAIQMINMNLDLNVKDYVTIGFTGVTKMVDDIGGVDIDVWDSEIVHLNNYQISMVGQKVVDEAGIEHMVADAYTDYIPVDHAGIQTLNGLQATAYCRIRYVGNDFMRTQRQRTVVTKIVDKAKVTDPTKLANVVKDTLGSVSTSLDVTEILSIAGDVANYQINEESYCFPFDDLRGGGMIGAKGSCVVPVSLSDNVTRLHSFLFGVENYEPSATVKECSDKIHADTSPYIGG